MAPTQDSVKETERTSTREPQRIEEENSQRMVSCDAIKNEFLCAICLSILKKTVTSQECLHRFCQECPTCRAKLTQSNLRADPVFDNLIEKLFPQSETSSYESDKKYLPTEASKDHLIESSRCEAGTQDLVSVTTLESQKKELQDQVFKGNTLTKEPHNISDGVYKGEIATRSDNANDSHVNISSKRKRNSGEEYEQAKNKTIHVEQIHDINSKIEPKEATPKISLNNKDQRKNKRVKNYRTPKRKSLRIEALQLEIEKNNTELEYNQRLSNGTAQVFFSLLELQPNNLEIEEHHLEKEPMEYEEENGIARGKEESAESNESVDKPETATRKGENVKSKEIVETSNTITQEEEGIAKKEAKLFLQKAVISDPTEKEYLHNDIPSSEIPVKSIIEHDEKYYKNIIKEHHEALEENAKVSNNSLPLARNVCLEEIDTKDEIVSTKVSEKKEKPRKVVLPLRRSQRFAAFMAQENISIQMASRKRSK